MQYEAKKFVILNIKTINNCRWIKWIFFVNVMMDDSRKNCNNILGEGDGEKQNMIIVEIFRWMISKIIFMTQFILFFMFICLNFFLFHFKTDIFFIVYKFNLTELVCGRHFNILLQIMELYALRALDVKVIKTGLCNKFLSLKCWKTNFNFFTTVHIFFV